MSPEKTATEESLKALEILRRVPYFAALDGETLRQVYASSRARSLDMGQMLFAEGGQCQGLCVVETGLMRIYKTSPAGREQVLLIAGPGDSFNEVPIFDGGPNPASATALAPSRVRVIPTNFLLESMRSNPQIAASILAVMSRRLRHLTMLVEDLSFRHVSSRVAKVLLEASESSRYPAQGGLLGSLTQQEMANIVGTTRQVVARSLKEMEAQGIIERHRKHISILKPALLRRFV